MGVVTVCSDVALVQTRSVRSYTSNLSTMASTGLHINGSFAGPYSFHDFELPHASQIGIISLYSVSTFLGISGNLVVILVLCFGNRSKTDLRPFLLNLAVSDLCMACFCMPFSFTQLMLGRWIFGEVACPVVKFFQVTSVCVSILTNVMIGIDRYRAIRFPLHQRMTRARIYLLLLFVWVVSVLVGFPQVLVARATKDSLGGLEMWQCGEKWPYHWQLQVYTLSLALLLFAIPLTLLAYTYSRVAWALWHQPSPNRDELQCGNIRLKAKVKITKMLVAIVVAFGICWFPLFTFNCVVDFAPELMDKIVTRRHEHMFLGTYLACHWLAMANSFVNPVIFGLLNESFRADLRYLCRRCICRRLWRIFQDHTLRPLRSRTSRTLSATKPHGLSVRAKLTEPGYKSQKKLQMYMLDT